MTTAYNLLKGKPEITCTGDDFTEYKYSIRKATIWFLKVLDYAEAKGYDRLKADAKSAVFHAENGAFVSMFIKNICAQLEKIRG